MTDLDRRFHETWLGMVQPIDGLVVSIPVLVDAQCMERQPPHVQATLLELCPPTRQGEAGPEGYAVADLLALFTGLLGYAPDAFDVGDALPEALSLYVPEGRQTVRATLGLRKLGADAASGSAAAGETTYEMLVWDIGAGAGAGQARSLDLDKPETVTGPWDYPPSAKFERLLRHARVPVGLLTNREVVRLVYAPHGESSGAITFRIDDMASVGGRPILDAFVMLLSANRFFGVAEERTLPAILAESRKRQANVTNDLADQVFAALQILLRGFEAAAERDGEHAKALMDDALARGADHVTKGLLTVLLRLVFVLYAEDRGLLPTDRAFYAKNLSALGLFEELQADVGAYPDSMSRRFGAWGRLVALFRAIYLGVSHASATCDVHMPARRGSLFNPHEYPFLEGWGPGGSAPITQAEDRAAVRVPSVDDETVFRVLEKLLVFEGQRLSYRALDVEQIGSVYEALMGYHVVRVPTAAVCTKPDRLWISAAEVTEVPAARRAKWLKETIGLSTAQAEKLNDALKDAGDDDAVLEALSAFAAGGKAGTKRGDPSLSRAKAGQLVLQPGTERRRTSSHYTPRSLSAPIVCRTLEPLLAVMGEAPASERILNLKVCDPAMGSGAFLVEACRFLADHVVAAWTREGKIIALAEEHGDVLLHARRLVAQRCLYGVDKNDAAVELAKLSLWLVTLSKTLPFTFLDHSLRHGDSLVGLDFEQIRAFHWKRADGEGAGLGSAKGKGAPKQLELFGREIAVALDEAILLRQKIGDLGDSPVDDREKARLFWDAQDALDRVRLIGDLVVGAFFAHEKDKDREAERRRREDLVRYWLGSGGPPSDELLAMQRDVRAKLPVFHWMAEFPEVFYAERPDPLDDGQVNRGAYMDALLGNPPFAGKTRIVEENGPGYPAWLREVFEGDTGVRGNCDLSAYFFRRGHALLGFHGCLGFIATNTIGQGDTRAVGLKALCDNGARIYEATSSLPWPGEAAVSVAVVHLAVGAPVARTGLARLDGVDVGSIDSRLREGLERQDASCLASNSSGLVHQGTIVLGAGFVLDNAETKRLMASAQNKERISPYLGGEDVNSSPTHEPSRYVINFGALGLETAEQWRDLIQIVRERVKPERDRQQGNNSTSLRRKRIWWQFDGIRPELYEAIGSLARCLVTSAVSKHRCFSFSPCGAVFDQRLFVFPFETCGPFAVLQSRAHCAWALMQGSSLEDRPTYRASSCFETFPFPKPDPRAVITALEDIGQRLYDFRAKYMVDENVGLTVTYNRLKDPACTEPRILELRKLHEEMDQKVLEAYAEGDADGRWLDLAVPPFCPMNDADKKKLEAFEDGVIDRLFVLNAKRAEEEKLAGLGPKQKGAKAKEPASKGTKSAANTGKETKAAGKAPASDAAAATATDAPAAVVGATPAKKRKGKKVDPAQASLLGSEGDEE